MKRAVVYFRDLKAGELLEDENGYLVSVFRRFDSGRLAVGYFSQKLEA